MVGHGKVRGWALGALAFLALGACAQPRGKTLVIPDEMLKKQVEPARPATRGTASVKGAASTQPTGLKAAAATSPAPLQGTDGPERYLVRMSEQGRIWEVELPESRDGFELRVPLHERRLDYRNGADQELLADALGTKDVVPAAGTARDRKPAAADAKAAQKDAERQLKEGPDWKSDRRAGYLSSVAKVKELYVARRYELALIELVDLMEDYPEDAQLYSMKGSLYLKLGRAKLAREAWEKSLSINPNDLGVAEALRTVSASEE